MDLSSTLISWGRISTPDLMVIRKEFYRNNWKVRHFACLSGSESKAWRSHRNF